MPILLLLHPDRDPETITATSLFVVFANATSGAAAYARFGRIDYRSGLWFALATLPGAILGAFVVTYVPRHAFDLVFAVVLASLGLYLLFGRGGTAIRSPITGRGVVTRTIPDRRGNLFIYSYRLWHGLAISAVVGFVSSFLGIGGGIIHVPAMVNLLHFPVHIAAATSHFVLAFMAGEGTAVHFATGALGWDRALWEGALLALGAIPGAQVGAYFAGRIRGTFILRALATALVLVGVRLMFLAFFE